jgi:acetyl/propionyl-CoA carboxylase alpha subunit/acetyl-CoA carboxylase carboxyltransferase component
MFKRLLIANRGEVALRIARAAADLGLRSVPLHADDNAPPSAYLDVQAVVTTALAQACDAVHPGYGFLSESADFAQACADAGLVFIGPSVVQLRLWGDKAQARAAASECGVPTLPGSAQAVDLLQAQSFFAQHADSGILIKAVNGGGGRGLRAVHQAADVAPAFALCRAEALAATGQVDVYVERLMRHARHIEIQVIGDGQQVMSLGERECSLQKRFQKWVEIAPSPSLSAGLRARLVAAALAMARSCAYRNLGTFEFLVNEQATESPESPFVFIEANPRLQVEHTITEQVLGLDLVQLQLGIAAGKSLAELGLDVASPPVPRGHAVQWRINTELVNSTPTNATTAYASQGGALTQLDWPTGAGLRVDTAARVGSRPNRQFDSLLAKLIVHTPGADFADVVRRSQRALAECQIEGTATNLHLLRALAARPEFMTQDLDTEFLEAHWQALQGGAEPAPSTTATATANATANAPTDALVADGETATLPAPMAGKLVQQSVAVGAVVPAGTVLAVIEAMKMQHALVAPQSARVLAWCLAAGEPVVAGQALLRWTPDAATSASDGNAALPQSAPTDDPRCIRPDLQRVLDRHAVTQDAARPPAMAKRHALGLRSARENIAALCDANSFSEYGALAVAAQRSRRSAEDLITNTPADGLVAGVGGINATLFGADVARAVVMAYDATVLAGTQGFRNHQKTDRLLGLALKNRLPVVLFAEGGGGRPGDVDMPIVAGLHVRSFASFARLSGQVPSVGIAAGRCFAGNAALLGCCDVIIATADSNIGMGGPAMIEGGGLGVFKAEDIGPATVQSTNGVIDVLVHDETQAVQVAQQYLGYFQGRLKTWHHADPQLLRAAVPANRQRVIDMRGVINVLFDTDSVLELRAGFGSAIVTALARIEGQPVGVMANSASDQAAQWGGAIDPTAADKAARFMQLCNAHGLPIVSLIDTPGFMVGPDIEKQAQVRHVSRLFVVAAALRVPHFSVVLRKAYGLGAMAMAAGGFHEGDFTVAWPTGEFGAMGLEGAVRLGYRKELAAAANDIERQALFDQLLAQQIDNGSALNMAATLEIDAVIDPAQTRGWLARGLASAKTRTQLGSHGCAAQQPDTARFIDCW